MGHIFKLSELNQFIKDVLSSGFPAPVWVTGEIQSYNRSKMKKHIFFELTEKDPNSNDIKARASLVIFERQKLQIQKILEKAENAFELKDDIEVKFLCRVDFYAPHGAVRLVVEGIDPTYTLGKIAQDKQKLIADLKKAGVLDKNKQLDLPLVPLRLGLITSDDSAAFNDFLNELKSSGFAFNVLVFNAIMQGKNCEASVVKGLEHFNKQDDVDMIIITRGGGSIADLACFDSKPIAMAIAQSRYPVFSGIGHEINTGVTDLAAHTFCITPTATAQFLVEQINDYLAQLDEARENLSSLAQEYVVNQKMALKEKATHVRSLTQDALVLQKERMVRISESIKRLPEQVLLKNKEYLSDRKESLLKSVSLQLEGSKNKIDHYRRLVDLASPQKILKRGFTLVRSSKGEILKSVKEISKDDQLITEFQDGKVESVVQ